MCERVTVQQAAKELGIAPQGVRVQMQRGDLDIGRVVKSVRGNGKRYLIYRDKLDRELGKTPRGKEAEHEGANHTD